MKRGALCLLFLLVLFPTAAFADSLDSITPSSLFLFDTEQFVTLQGTNLFGSVDTHIVINGPAGIFTLSSSGGSHDPGTGIDTLFLAIPGEVMVQQGHYLVTVLANDGANVRSIGPNFFDVIPRQVPPQNPLIFVPENVFGEAASPSGANVFFDVSGFSFVDPTPPAINCGGHPSGSLFPLGTTTVTCTATDSFGAATASFPVIVTDTTPPILQVSDIISGSPVVTFSITATDNVDSSASLVVTCTPPSGSTFPAGTTLVQCHTQDSHANTGRASFKVTIIGGANAPVLTMPADILTEATSPAGAPVTFVVTATDNATITCTPASGSTFAPGLTSVSCSATSPGGTSTDSFKVTVVDTTRPILTVPADINTSATSANGAVVTFTVSAIDLVDGVLPVSCNFPSGSTFAIGTTNVFCSATDASGNFGFGSFTVTVSNDTTPPVLSLPANITAEATSAAGAVVTYVATATDAIDGPVAITCSPISGSTFPIGITTVQCSASDTHNNAALGSFIVTVRDTTPPALSLPANITAEATSASGAVVTYTATATDLVDGSRPVTCDHASGSTFPIGSTTVQCTATDTSGNTAHGSFSVLVRDTTPPALSLPANITAEATSASGAVVTYTATATDLVDGSRPVTCDHASGSTFPLGSTTVQCTAADAHSNTAHGSFLVTVRDTTPPVLSLPANITAEATSPNGAVVTYTATSTDLVDGSRPVTCDHASGSTFPLGSTTVQCTATDTHNNTAQGSFTVLVRDTTPPHIVSITASPNFIWPPNHKLVTVTITVIATDAVDNNPVSHIVSVRSNGDAGEDDHGGDDHGNGDDELQWKITGPLTVQLRADNDDHRVYTITIETTDFSGNKTQGTVKVAVANPHGHASH